MPLKVCPQALYIQEAFQLDLQNIRQDLRKQFVDSLTCGSAGVPHNPPKLIVTVAGTHAGLITRNNGFYRPDVMREYLHTFVEPFQKPVQLHHNDKIDPIGRVQRAIYVDTTHLYSQPIREFRERYGGKTFIDAKTDFEKAQDQFKWACKNLFNLKDYRGLGFGELDLGITDTKAAEKILDERYLTVSVGFTTTDVHCSHCGQNWAQDGLCEHTPGQKYDGFPMVLMPSNILYDETSFVNNPADPFGQVTKVLVTNFAETPGALDQSDNTEISPQLIKVVPILFGVNGQGAIYRLDFEDRAQGTQEILTVPNKQDKNKEPEAPVLLEQDGVNWPETAKTLLADATRENYVTDEAGITKHKHRVIVDPATGNGHSDYVLDHSHDVVNKEIQESGPTKWDADKNEYLHEDDHKHGLKEKVSPLKDETAEQSITDSTAEAQDETAAPAGSEETKKSDKEVAEVSDATDADQWYDQFVVPELSELGLEDKKLSTEQRKKLKGSTFCGPDRSFPVPDCAHYTAALRLLGRYKGGGDKTKIRACIERKGRSLGCTKGAKDQDEARIEFQVPTSESEKPETFTLMSSDCVAKLVAHLKKTSRLNDEIKTRLLEAGKVFGMEAADLEKLFTDEVTLAKEPESIDKAIDRLSQTSAQIFDETTITSFIDQLVAVKEEDVRNKLIDTLMIKLIEKDLVPNYDQEFADLAEENEELKTRLERLMAANKDLYLSRQHFLAETIVKFRRLMQVDGFTNMADEEVENRIAVLQLRSTDSLIEVLDQLVKQLVEKESIPGIEHQDSVEPGKVNLPDSTTKVEDSTQKKSSIDFKGLIGTNDLQYALARKIQAAFQHSTAGSSRQDS